MVDETARTEPKPTYAYEVVAGDVVDYRGPLCRSARDAALCLEGDLDGLAVGESVTVRVTRSEDLSDAAYEALPEWMGP